MRWTQSPKIKFLYLTRCLLGTGYGSDVRDFPSLLVNGAEASELVDLEDVNILRYERFRERSRHLHLTYMSMFPPLPPPSLAEENPRQIKSIPFSTSSVADSECASAIFGLGGFLLINISFRQGESSGILVEKGKLGFRHGNKSAECTFFLYPL